MASSTKQAIIASFLKLCAQKSPDKITVRDIVDDCDINRNTFYYYFQDIYAVLEEIFCIWTQSLDGICEADGDITQSLCSVADWAAEHKRAVVNIFRGLDGTVLEDYYLSAVTERWRSWVRLYAKDDVSTEAVNYVSMTLSIGAFSVIRRWVRNSMRDDPHLIMEHYSRTCLSDVERMLSNYQSSFGKNR